MKVLDKKYSESFLYVKKLEKGNAIDIYRNVQETFPSFFVPYEQEHLPMIQIQLWEIEGDGIPVRSLLEEAYLLLEGKQALVSFIEQRDKEGRETPSIGISLRKSHGDL